MPDTPRVVVRADGSPAMGLGHVVRSHTLAQSLAEAGCAVTFRGAGFASEIVGSASDIVVVELGAPDGSAADAAATAAEDPHLVVVDGYHFTAEFFEQLEAAGVAYAVIDDNAETPARRPIAVLNQNPHATSDMYAHMHGAPELMLGLDYSLIRREVRDVAARGLERVPGAVFVAMGGSDPAGVTVPVVEALSAEVDEVWVACGPAMSGRAQVVESLSHLPRVVIVEQADYVRALAQCEFAVLAAGSTLWEARALGTETIAVVVSPNQVGPAAAAVAAGVAHAAVESPEIGGQLIDAIHTLRADREERRPAASVSGPDRVATRLTIAASQRMRRPGDTRG